MHKTSIKPFTYLLIAQAFSIFGTSLTGFALGVWVFNEVGSVTIYSLIALANGVPIILFSPLAGAIVDRISRKKIILAAQFSSLSVTVILMVLYWTGLLHPWHIIGLVALNSVCLAFVLPAVTATVPLMVPKEQLTRANGMIALAFGIIQLTGPATSGTLYDAMGMKVIFIVDLFTYVVAISTVLATLIPQPCQIEAAKNREESVWSSIKDGLIYLQKNKSLRNLVVFYSLTVSMLMSMSIMIQPMVLAFTSAKTLGFIVSFASCGILAGSIAMIALKNINKHIPFILYATFCAGLLCIFTPTTQKPALLALGGFFIMSCFPIFDANNRSLLQRKVAPNMLGRITGIRNFALGISKSCMLMAAGLIADKFFTPSMQPNGALTPYLAGIYGVGNGRGIAVMISLLGISIVFLGFIAITVKSIRQIDTLLEDYKPAEDSIVLS